MLGAVEGVLGGSQWGAVGVGAGSRGGGDWWGGGGTPGGGCWGPRRGRLVGWYGAPWGWVLRAALGAVEEVSGGRGGGCWGPGGGRRRRSAGGRGGRCWEPRRGRAGAPHSEYKHPRSPPSAISRHTDDHGILTIFFKISLIIKDFVYVFPDLTPIWKISDGLSRDTTALRVSMIARDVSWAETHLT